jgi:hypothetical protein
MSTVPRRPRSRHDAGLSPRRWPWAVLAVLVLAAATAAWWLWAR